MIYSPLNIKQSFLFSFVLFSFSKVFSQESEIDSITLNRKIIFHHQYAIEHSFADFNNSDKNLKGKTLLSGTPVLGIGIRYKINEQLLFGGQSSWGIQRSNFKITHNYAYLPNNIVYSINYWYSKNAIMFSLKMDEKSSISFLAINTMNLYMGDNLQNGRNFNKDKSKAFVIKDSLFFENRIGIDYEIKPFKERFEKLFFEIEVPMRQRKLEVQNLYSIGTFTRKYIYYQPIIFTFGLRF